MQGIEGLGVVQLVGRDVALAERRHAQIDECLGSGPRRRGGTTAVIHPLPSKARPGPVPAPEVESAGSRRADTRIERCRGDPSGQRLGVDPPAAGVFDLGKGGPHLGHEVGHEDEHLVRLVAQAATDRRSGCRFPPSAGPPSRATRRRPQATATRRHRRERAVRRRATRLRIRRRVRPSARRATSQSLHALGVGLHRVLESADDSWDHRRRRSASLVEQRVDRVVRLGAPSSSRDGREQHRAAVELELPRVARRETGPRRAWPRAPSSSNRRSGRAAAHSTARAGRSSRASGTARTTRRRSATRAPRRATAPA